ncbi:MAG: Y-family DNA polymerase [Bacteriovorax sp.]|nr:Y-family DNA polymerase [Bacteriovorax sp.]
MLDKILFSKNCNLIFDVDGCYAGVECVDKPELRGEPIAILGNTGGIVIAASREAKALGIDIGVTAWEIKKVAKGNHVYVFSANFETYAYFSRLLFTVLRRFTSYLKIYSIDEGLLDLNHVPSNERLKYGLTIIDTIYKETRLKGCVGIAPNITLMKVAIKIAKKNPVLKGVFEINEHNIDWALEQTPVEKLWGIGSARAKQLRKLGINNAKQFRDYPGVEKIQKLLTVNGRKIQLELKGMQCFRIDEPIEKKKEISHMRTLGTGTADLNYLKQSLATYTTLASEDMRKEGSVCKEVRLFMLTDYHRPELPQYGDSIRMSLPAYTMDTVKIIRVVWKLLDSMYHPDYEFKKIGVTLSKLQNFEDHQYSLYNDDDDPKRINLMKTLDKINKKYKSNTIRSAACGIGNGNFEASRPRMTPSYCTNWSEVLVIDKIIGNLKNEE